MSSVVVFVGCNKENSADYSKLEKRVSDLEEKLSSNNTQEKSSGAKMSTAKPHEGTFQSVSRQFVVKGDSATYFYNGDQVAQGKIEGEVPAMKLPGPSPDFAATITYQPALDQWVYHQWVVRDTSDGYNDVLRRFK